MMMRSPYPMRSAVSGALPCFAAIVLLIGCTTDDPREGGLLGGLAGLGSGAYQGRVVDETAALQAERIRYRRETDGKTQLEDTLMQRQSYALDVERELVTLREEIDGIDAEITAIESEEVVTQDEVEKVKAAVASLLDDIERIKAEQAAEERAKALGADAGQDADPAEFGEPPLEQVSDLRAYIDKLQAAVDSLKATRDRRMKEALAGSVQAAD